MTRYAHTSHTPINTPDVIYMINHKNDCATLILRMGICIWIWGVGGRRVGLPLSFMRNKPGKDSKAALVPGLCEIISWL